MNQWPTRLMPAVSLVILFQGPLTRVLEPFSYGPHQSVISDIASTHLSIVADSTGKYPHKY